MTEFKIEYQIRRDSEGKESVHKVYLPSTYKGWAITAERKDPASPGAEAFPSEIPMEAEKPSNDHQGPSAQDFHDGPVQRYSHCLRRRGGSEYQLEQLTKFKAVNGVVSPSRLEPGHSPIGTHYRPSKDYARVGTRRTNMRCPICGDWFPRKENVSGHFIHCVARNGNPQGYYWDGALNDERRIGKQIAELYCKRGGGGDQDTETSTDDGGSGNDPHTISYEPSEPCSYSQPSGSRSLAVTPCLRHDRNDYTGVSLPTQTRTDHGYGNRVSDLVDEEVDDRNIAIPKNSTERQAKTPANATQGPPSEQLRDPQAHRLPLRYDNIKRAWASTTPETVEQRRSEANTIRASGYDDTHGDFDAIHRISKTGVPIQSSQVCHTTSSAYTTPTLGDLGAGRSTVSSPGNATTSLTSPVGYPNRQRYLQPKPHPSSLPSGAKGRRIPSELSSLSQSSKRQRMLSTPVLPSQQEKMLQTKTAAGPRSQPKERGHQRSPTIVEGLALSLSRTRSTSGEMMEENHARARQSKGLDLRMNTEAAESATVPTFGIEPTPGDELCADSIKSHKEFRRELDILAREIDAANKRADTAELRVRIAENMVYQANNAGFTKLKMQEDTYKKENETQQRAYKSLMIRCDALELSISGKNQERDELKWDLKHEQQMSAIVRSEHARRH